MTEPNNSNPSDATCQIVIFGVKRTDYVRFKEEVFRRGQTVREVLLERFLKLLEEYVPQEKSTTSKPKTRRKKS